VLDGAPVPDVLGALAGLPLGADDLRRILVGCPAGEAGEGRRYEGGWTTVALGAETRAFVRAVGGRPVLAALDVQGWQAEYAGWIGGIARTVRVHRPAGPAATDLTAALDDLTLNVDLPAAAFEVEIPDGARPITLDDLRAASPLQGRGQER
jgi:hypothetical protein